MKPGDLLLDPFVGSGTTLLACKEMGIDGIGIDAAPLAVFVTQVKTADYNLEELKETAKWLFSQKFEKPDLSSVSNFVKKFFLKPSLEDIIFFREKVREIGNPVVRNFFTLALMNSAMKASFAYKDGGVPRVVEKPVPPFRKFFKRVVKKMIRDLKRLTIKPCNIQVYLGDARKMDFLEDETVNAVITSPPYLNKIEYTKVYKIEYELFFGDVEMDAIRSYLGMNPKNVVDPFPELNLPEVAKAYFHDIKLFLRELYRVLKLGAAAAIVIAGGVFPDRVVDSDILTAGLAEEIGFKLKKIIAVNKRAATTRRVIKIGKARESIIIIRKLRL